MKNYLEYITEKINTPKYKEGDEVKIVNKFNDKLARKYLKDNTNTFREDYKRGLFEYLGKSGIITSSDSYDDGSVFYEIEFEDEKEILQWTFFEEMVEFLDIETDQFEDWEDLD